MSGSAGVAGAYEVEEGKARMSDGYFAGDDREQEDDIILLTHQRSEVS